MKLLTVTVSAAPAVPVLVSTSWPAASIEAVAVTPTVELIALASSAGLYLPTPPEPANTDDSVTVVPLTSKVMLPPLASTVPSALDPVSLALSAGRLLLSTLAQRNCVFTAWPEVL